MAELSCGRVMRVPSHPDSAVSRFTKPWHSQLFALTVALNEAGIFQWADFAHRLGAQLKRDNRDKNGEDDYYDCWLVALILLLEESHHLDKESLKQRVAQWQKAYLSTPHGQPIQLKD